MEVSVKHEKDQKTQLVRITGNTVAAVLSHLGINPETVLVVRNNTVLTQDITLQENDELELLSVISGG